MGLQFTKATRKQTRARVALIGPAGSGKTYSALAIGARLGKRVAVIDTERGSAEKYAEKFNFDHLDLPRFAPRDYIDALSVAGREGFEVVIIDSLSHAWEGEGGILDQVDQRGGKFEAWKDMSPQTRNLIEAILTYPGHVIATLRAKTEYTIEKNERGKMEPHRVGLAPKFKDGLEYEFDVVGILDDANIMTVVKSRADTIANGSVAVKPGAGFGDVLRKWCDAGATAVPALRSVPDEPAPAAPPPPPPAKPAPKKGGKRAAEEWIAGEEAWCAANPVGDSAVFDEWAPELGCCRDKAELAKVWAAVETAKAAGKVPELEARHLRLTCGKLKLSLPDVAPAEREPGSDDE